MATPARRIEPLETGDRMTRAEFHRRYLEHPEIKKAELVEGVVYVPSPVRTDMHAQPHAHMARWLSVYCETHAEVSFVIDATLELDNDNEPQPDLLLRYEQGGRSTLTPEGYLAGAPELVIEIAASSRAYDMHDKLQAYRRNGIQEYLVWQVLDGHILWFALEAGAYVPIAEDADGLLRSRVFPGLALDAPAMLRGDMAGVIAAQRNA